MARDPRPTKKMTKAAAEPPNIAGSLLLFFLFFLEELLAEFPEFVSVFVLVLVVLHDLPEVHKSGLPVTL